MKNKLTKSLFTIFLVLITVFGISACSKSNQPTEENNTVSSNQNNTVTDEYKQPELVDSGYTIIQDENYCLIYYSVEIKNPNSEYAIEFPTITLTSKTEDGTIIDTQEQIIHSIAASDTFKYATKTQYEGKKASTVDISVSSGVESYNYIIQDDAVYPQTKDFVVNNISNTTNNSIFGDEHIFTGEIINSTKNSYSTLLVCVNLYKDGKLVGGNSTFIDNVTANQTKAFKIEGIPTNIEFDNYEINACPWA